MTKFSLKHLLVAACMFSGAGLALALKPTQQVSASGPAINLETLIPTKFGTWTIDQTIVPIMVSPDVQAQLDKIYGQTLSRTYVNDKGERVMLSIAYGANQVSEDLQVHRPEYCYAAQGFQVRQGGEDVLAYGPGKLQVKRLEATQGDRVEPITYWITIGDQATLPGIGRKLTQLSYGLTGKIPDGMLIRVSSITPDINKGYQNQDRFVKDMLDSLDTAQRVRLTGTL